MFKVNNRDTRTTSFSCLYLLTLNISVSIVNFGHAIANWEKSKNGFFFWSVFRSIITESESLQSKSLYPVQISKSTDKKKQWALFSCCENDSEKGIRDDAFF